MRRYGRLRVATVPKQALKSALRLSQTLWVGPEFPECHSACGAHSSDKLRSYPWYGKPAAGGHIVLTIAAR